MTDRTRKSLLAKAIGAAVLLLCGSTLAIAADEKPYARHVDLEASFGAHVGLEEEVPLEDNLIAGFAAAVPISRLVDAEFGASYFTGRDAVANDHRDGGYFHAAVRVYPFSKPEDRTRFFLFGGPSFMLDWRSDDDWTPAVNLGAGFRFRVGDRTGLVLHAPVVLMLEGDTKAIGLPTISFFFQL